MSLIDDDLLFGSFLNSMFTYRISPLKQLRRVALLRRDCRRRRAVRILPARPCRSSSPFLRGSEAKLGGMTPTVMYL